MVIQHRLVQEPQHQAVLSLVEKYLPKFDLINMTLALHQLAKASVENELIMRQVQSSPAFVSLFNKLKTEVVANVETVDAMTITDFLWGCSNLNIYDNEICNAIATHAANNMETYTPLAITLLIHSLGKLGVRPRAALIQAVVRELRERIDYDFDSRHLCMMIYGLMRLGIRDERVMKVVSDFFLRTKLVDAEPLTVACLNYAYAKLEYWDAEVFNLLGRRTLDNFKDLDPQMITMSALCFSTASAYLEGASYVMQQMFSAMDNLRLANFTNRDLSTWAFAAGKYALLTSAEESDLNMRDANTTLASPRQRMLGIAATVMLDELEQRTLDSFTMQELNLINYSLMRMGKRDADFLEIAALCFKRQAPELQAIEINNCLYAFGKSQFLHVGFVAAMVEEVKRRGLLESMDNLALVTLAFSLAKNQVKEDEVLEKIIEIVCGRVRELDSRQITMIMWAAAQLGNRKMAEPFTSICLEEMAQRLKKGSGADGLPLCMWAGVVLSGAAAALWILEIIFTPGFWNLMQDIKAYSMLYTAFASLGCEQDINVQELIGYKTCRRIYEEETLLVSNQTQRLSLRLRMLQIAHEANYIVTSVKKGVNDAGLRGDIVLEKLQLVIEVEGPQRQLLKLQDFLTAPKKESRKEMGPAKYFGTPADVLREVQESLEIESALQGPALFKRRLLRRCGWRVITLSFNENEEYIASALDGMMKKDPNMSRPVSEEESELPPDEDLYRSFDPTNNQVNVPVRFDEDEEQSLYEQELRKRHAAAMKELRRRIAEERGDAAATGEYSDHIAYRRWQVGLEKEITREMVAQVQEATREN